MSNSAPPSEAASVIAQEFLVDEPCALAVDVPGAFVRLRPGQQTDRVEVNIAVGGCPPAEAEDILDRMQIGTQQMKDKVRVYSDGDRSDAEWWRWVRTLDVDIHVEVRLPSRVEAELRAPGGEIDVADLEGTMDLQVMGGSCRAENLEGNLSLRAESSDVFINRLTGDDVNVRVAVGSVQMEDVQAESLSLRSVAAPVTLTSVEGAISVTANSTPVDLQNVTGPCTARCQGGALTYTGTPPAETELTVVGSRLSVDLPSAHAATLTMTGDTVSLDDDFAFEGERREHEIEGTLNDGGPALILRAIGGTVECRAS